jgi:hypothetical protein
MFSAATEAFLFNSVPYPIELLLVDNVLFIRERLFKLRRALCLKQDTKCRRQVTSLSASYHGSPVFQSRPRMNRLM